MGGQARKQLSRVVCAAGARDASLDGHNLFFPTSVCSCLEALGSKPNEPELLIIGSFLDICRAALSSMLSIFQVVPCDRRRSERGGCLVWPGLSAFFLDIQVTKVYDVRRTP